MSRPKAYLCSNDRWEVIDISLYRHCRPVRLNNHQTMVIQCDGSQVAIYHAGAYHFLHVSDWTKMQAHGLNAMGNVVGYYRPNDGYARAFVYDGMHIHDIGTLDLDTGYYSSAFAINDDQVIVGASGSLREVHAFRYDAHGMHDLGTLAEYKSKAIAINNVGDSVGYAFKIEHNIVYSRALLWEQDELIDLNTLIDEPDWLLQKATAINDVGQIAGYGLCDDIPTVFLLTPQEC